MDVEIKLKNQGPDLTLDEIEAFEREINGQLSDGYKQFLLSNNGGITQHDHPVGVNLLGKIEEVPVFYALQPSSQRGLRNVFSNSNLRQVNIDGFLVIASTIDDKDICIDISKNIGSVYWVVYSRMNDVAVAANMFSLADSFEEFLEGLVEIEEPFCPVENMGKKGTAEDLVKYLTEGNSIDAISKNGLSILCESIKFSNGEMMQACIERGASLSKSVYIAVANGRKDLLKTLVDAGADINEQDEFGDRPIKHVPGICLPGEEGARNRALREELLRLGAIEEENEEQYQREPPP